MAETKNYGLVRSIPELKAMVAKLLRENKPVGFDIETGYEGPDRKKGALFMDWPGQFITGFSITNGTNWARYVPVAHDLGPNLPEYEAWEIIKPVLETLPVIAHNMKFEVRNVRLLEQKGRGPRIDINIGGDSMLQSYVLQRYERHNLKELTKWVFNHEQATFKSLFPGTAQNKEKFLRFNHLELTSEVYEYACEDAVWTLALYEKFKAQIDRIPAHQQMLAWEMEILDVLIDMEEAGVYVDWDGLEKSSAVAEPFEERMRLSAIRGLEKQSGKDLSGLNLASPAQLKALLYRDMGMKTTRLTDSAKDPEKAAGKEQWELMSTDENALAGLAKKYPPVQKILEVRQVHNLLKRHEDWLVNHSISHDRRVHASFGQSIVASGRFAANDPAIQQVPKEWRHTTALGADVWDDDIWDKVLQHGQADRHYWTGNFRDFVTSAPGYSLIGYDYSQIELRMLAGLSQEPALLQAFAEGQDVHTLTAAMMLGKDVADISGKDRAVGKTMNFALLYQMGVKSLAERLAISMERANELYDQYFSAFTLVGRWMDEQKSKGVRQGYVTTRFGRKVPIWEFQSNNRAIYGKGERVCINAPVQGSAADYMKIAMLRAARAMKEKGWWGEEVRLLNNLHDALTFEVHDSIDPWEFREVLSEAVVFPIDNTFPEIVADWEIGHRWGSAAKWTHEHRLTHGETGWRIAEDEEPTHAREVVEVAERIVADVETLEETEDLGLAVAPQQEAFRIVVREMPTKDRWEKFVRLVKSKEGQNTLVLQTPEGDLDIPVRTGLTVKDSAQVAFIFEGASIQYEERETA